MGNLPHFCLKGSNWEKPFFTNDIEKWANGMRKNIIGRAYTSKQGCVTAEIRCHVT